MANFPPEVVSHIMTFSLPPHRFKTFVGRSSILRSFSLVDRKWRVEAQRLLLQLPIFDHHKSKRRSGGKHVKEFEKALVAGGGGGTIEEVRVWWGGEKADKEGGGLERLLRIEAITGLRKLTLCRVTLDTELLHELKSLDTLILVRVDFKPTTNSRPLTQLKYLTINSDAALPSCLLLPQLPSLKALATGGRSETLSTVDYLLTHPRGNLKLLAFPGGYLHDRTDDEIARINEFTLVSRCFTDFLVPMIQRPMPFQHVRLEYSRKWNPNMRTEKMWENLWARWLPAYYKDLKTVVIPALWKEEVSQEKWGVLEGFSRRYKVEILIEEDESMMESCESGLSPVFMEHWKIV